MWKNGRENAKETIRFLSSTSVLGTPRVKFPRDFHAKETIRDFHAKETIRFLSSTSVLGTPRVKFSRDFHTKSPHNPRVVGTNPRAFPKITTGSRKTGKLNIPTSFNKGICVFVRHFFKHHWIIFMLVLAAWVPK